MVRRLRTRSLRTLARRALLLRCPLCGVSPIFGSFRRHPTLKVWILPLDGCPRCGYAYEREEGYFLLATWVVNYGVACVFGLALWQVLEAASPLRGGWLLAATLAPMALLSILLVRHSKALWLAIDHGLDPAAGPSRTPSGGEGRAPREDPPG